MAVFSVFQTGIHYVNSRNHSFIYDISPKLLFPSGLQPTSLHSLLYTQYIAPKYPYTSLANVTGPTALRATRLSTKRFKIINRRVARNTVERVMFANK
jgi:hypothetical protein